MLPCGVVATVYFARGHERPLRAMRRDGVKSVPALITQLAQERFFQLLLGDGSIIEQPFEGPGKASDFADSWN